MPIGRGEAYLTHRNRYEEIIKPAVEGLLDEAGSQIFQCVRADFVTSTGSITEDVIDRLYRSDVVLADLTDLNSNVFYELGVRHALRSGTILVALKDTPVPFDLHDLRIIFYEDKVGAQKIAIPQIQEMLSALLAPGARTDSPVYSTLPDLISTTSQDVLRHRLAQVEEEATRLRVQVEVGERYNVSMQETIDLLRDTADQLLARLSPAEQADAKAVVERVTLERSEITAHPVPDTAQTSPQFALAVVSRDNAELVTALRTASHHVELSVIESHLIKHDSILDRVPDLIASSRKVFADFSERDENVDYVVSLAIAAHKEVVLLIRDLEDVPPDMRHHPAVLYEPSFSGLVDLGAYIAREVPRRIEESVTGA